MIRGIIAPGSSICWLRGPALHATQIIYGNFMAAVLGDQSPGATEPPPRDRIAGTAVFIPSHAPVRLTSNTARHSSSLAVSIVPNRTIPALLTTMPRPPQSSVARATGGLPVGAPDRRQQMLYALFRVA